MKNFLRIKNTRGLSLIELLIYLTILSAIVLVLVNLFIVTVRIRAQSNAKFAVNENARVVLGTMRDAILDSSTAAVSGACPLNKLDLTVGGVATTFQVTNGAVEIVEGVNPAKAITSGSVVASTSAACLFAKIDNPAPAKPTVQLKLRMYYNAPGNVLLQGFQDYQLTVSLR